MHATHQLRAGDGHSRAAPWRSTTAIAIEIARTIEIIDAVADQSAAVAEISGNAAASTLARDIAQRAGHLADAATGAKLPSSPSDDAIPG